MALRDFLTRIGVIREEKQVVTELTPTRVVTGVAGVPRVIPTRPITRTTTVGGRTVVETISPTGQVIETKVIKEPEPTVKERLTQEVLRARKRRREAEVIPKLPKAVARVAIVSGEKIVRPTLRFLRGELPFQKKLEPTPREPIEKKPSDPALVEFEKKFGIRKVMDDAFWGFSGKIDKLLKKIGVKEGKSVLTTEVDVNRFRNVPSDILLWGLFAPALSTGAAGAKQIRKIRQKNPLTKTRFDALGEQLNKLEVEVASKATLKEQTAFLKSIRDQLTTPEQIKGFDTWVKSLIEKQIIRVPQIPIEVVTPKPPKVRTIKGVLEAEVPKIREVKFLAPATTLKAEEVQQPSLFFRQPQRVITTEAQRTAQEQALLTKQAQEQAQRLRQEQVARQAARLLSLQTTALGLKQVARQIPKAKVKKVLKEVRIKFPKGVSKTKLATELAKISKKKKGVDVVVGMKIGKQRTIAKNLPPFKALKFARAYVDKNIEASFRLKRTGKTTRKKDIKPFNVGKKFRPSKRNPLFVVEKRKYRLDSPSEKKQIKLARRLKLV